MATYYTSDDLQARRHALISYLCSQTKRLKNHYFYGSLLSGCEMNKLEYLTAMMEVIECYTPITLAAEDGETNCLTEAQLTAAFDNISDLTGICFQPIGTTYNDSNIETAITTDTLDTNLGPAIVLNTGQNTNLNQAS